MRVCRGLAAFAALTAAGCVHGPFTLQLQPALGGRCGQVALCQDGEPAKLDLGRNCPAGVCGFSCVPGRWD